MTDIAALAFSIDSSQALAAGQALDGLTGKARDVAIAQRQMAADSLATQQANAALRSELQQTTAIMTGQVTALDQMIMRLDTLRSSLGTSLDSIKGFRDVQLQADAMARSIGTTATAMETYYRAGQQLGFATPEIANSMQRITEALQNQTSAGQATRQMLLNLGVDLKGLGLGDADTVLQRLTDRLRTFADTQQRMRSAESILGPLSMDTYGKIDNPDYVPLERRRDIQLQKGYDTRVANTARDAALRSQQAGRDATEFQDLAQTYSVNGLGVNSLSASQQGSLRDKLGLATDGPASEADQLTMLRYLRDNPNSAEAKSAMTVSGRVAENWRNSGVNALMRHFSTGDYGADAAEITARYQEDKAGDTSWLGSKLGVHVMPWLSAVGRDVQNVVGAYTPQKPLSDGRQVDPVEQYLNNSATAGTLAGYGFSDVQSRLGAQQQLRALQPDGNRDEILGQFKGAYGGAEGTRRFYDVRDRLQHQMDTAMTPGQDEIDSTAMQGWIDKLPADQMARGRALLGFAQKNNVNTQAWTANNLSLDELMNPQAGGPGMMGPDLLGGFNKIQAGQTANQGAVFDAGVKRQVDGQKALQSAVRDGAAAMEDALTKYQAYQASLATTSDKLEAQREAEKQLTIIMERRKTVADEMEVNADLANRNQDALLSDVAAAGSDPGARSAARLNAQISQRAVAANRSNSQVSVDNNMALQRVALGQGAVGQASDQVASLTHELDLQKQLLAVAGERGDIQDKLKRDQEVDAAFVNIMAQAQASGEKYVAIVQAAIDRVKELRGEAAQVKFDTDNVAFGSKARQEAQTTDLLGSIPADQRENARSLLPVLQQNLSNPALFKAALGPANGLSADIAEASQATGMPPWLLTAMQSVENAKRNPDGSWATSSKGAVGSMQVMPDTFDEMAKKYRISGGINDDHANVMAGAYYLRDQVTAHGGNYRDGLAAYNAGPGKIQEGYGYADKVTGKAQVNVKEMFDALLSASPDSPLGQALHGAADKRNADVRLQVQTTSEADDYATRQRQASIDATSRGSGAQRLASAAVVDPNVDPRLGQQKAAIAVGTARQDFLAQFENEHEASRRQIEDNQKLADSYSVSDAALLRATNAAKAHADALKESLSPSQEMQRAQDYLGQTVSETALKVGEQAKTARETTADNVALARAWESGSAAAQAVGRSIQLEPMMRLIDAMSKQANQSTETKARIDALRQSLMGLAQTNGDVAASEQTKALRQASSRLSDDTVLQNTDAAISPLVGPQGRETQMAMARASQQIANDSSLADPGAKAKFLSDTKTNLDAKFSAQDTAQLRQGFQEMGSAASSAFESAVLGGKNLRSVFAGLLQDIAKIGLQMAVEAPLKKMFGTALDGAASGGGGLLGWLGFGGGMAGGNPIIAGATGGAGGMTAMGGAFANGVKLNMYAGGGVLDRPSTFPMANGGTGLAGEMAAEGVLPLRRLANGNLGVEATGGGSGGHTFNLHSSVVVQGGMGGGMGGASADDANSIGASIARAQEAQILKMITTQIRPGGMLASGGAGRQGSAFAA